MDNNWSHHVTSWARDLPITLGGQLPGRLEPTLHSCKRESHARSTAQPIIKYRSNSPVRYGTCAADDSYGARRVPLKVPLMEKKRMM